MVQKIQVKEHLRSRYLYEPSGRSYISSEWKSKLFRQQANKQALKNALMERPSFLKELIYMSTVFMCFTFAIATYLGYINPAHWFDNISQISKFNIPPIGLKEILIFVILINGLTFIIRKRSYFLNI